MEFTVTSLSDRIALYSVGGSVRDRLLGIPSNDLDFTVVVSGTKDIDDAWNILHLYLEEEGFTVFLSTREYLTVRARFPKGHKHGALTADFVLARREGPYSDNRRPDWVVPGTLWDDLARRDFTVNSLAEDSEGHLIDPYDGQRDLRDGILAAVGRAEDRIREDPLRALRAIRFSVTKGFWMHPDLTTVLHSVWLPDMVAAVSEDRRRDELNKMLKVSTMQSLRVIGELSMELREAIFAGNLRLEATSKK